MGKLYIKQKVFSLIDKYKVFDENQNLLYRCEGKLFSLSGRMNLLNKNDEVIYRFSHRLFTFRRSLEISDRNDNYLGTLVKRMFTFTPKLIIEVNGETYEITGSFFQYSFNIIKNNKVVVTVDKEILTWGDTYEIDIKDEENKELLLALVIGIDTLIHNDRYK